MTLRKKQTPNKKTIYPVATATLVTLLLGASPTGLASGEQYGKSIDSPGSKTLDFNEQTHLEFMREEEKLARDVYITLGMQYPQLSVFGNIDDSEQRHTCAVCDMLKKYGVEDPNTNDNVGVFTGADYAPYFTEKYQVLVEGGSASSIKALYTGAYIEELDMLDINYCPQEIIDLQESLKSESDCGKIYTDNPDIQHLYTSLLEGSKSHLRAFVKNIERFEGEGSYQAQILTQAQVDEILER